MALMTVNWRPDRGQLRGFALACLLALGLLGAWVFFRRSLVGFPMPAATARSAAWVLWALAALCGVLAAAAPRGIYPLYLALTAVSLPIGLVVSHGALALLFYGVLTPVGLLFRLVRRDPLHRRFDSSARSYWVRREAVTDVRRYFRQF